MTTHVKEECKSPCERPGTCLICDGGLFICTVCYGAEGTLPSECPKVPMSEEQREKVIAGKLDFVDGEWRSI